MTADWAMVIITAIYAITTIAILCANISATNAAKESNHELKRQFDEMNRPIIETEIIYSQRAFVVIRFINHGSRTAYGFRFSFSEDFVNSLWPVYRRLITEQYGKESIIGVGQYYDVFIGGNEYVKSTEKLPIIGEMSYCYDVTDGIIKKYDENINIDINNYMTIFSVDSDEEKLRGLLKEQNDILSDISKELRAINKKWFVKNSE